VRRGRCERGRTSLGSVVGRLRLRDVDSSSRHRTDEDDRTGGVSAHHVLSGFTSGIEGAANEESDFDQYSSEVRIENFP